MSAPETLVAGWPEPHTCPAAAGRRHAAARAPARRAIQALQAAGWDVVAVGGPHRDPPHWLGGRARHWVSGVEVTAEGPTLEALYAALWERAQVRGEEVRL